LFRSPRKNQVPDGFTGASAGSRLVAAIGCIRGAKQLLLSPALGAGSLFQAIGATVFTLRSSVRSATRLWREQSPIRQI
jgi:hypothetical protein